MSSQPRATMLIGAFNSAHTIPRAIASILGQTVADLELLVIDDGSTDDSVGVARAAIGDDPRGRVVPLGRNLGIARSLNHGLREARADVVAVLDADDWAEPHRLERQLSVLHAEPDVAVVGSRMREVDEEGRELAPRTRFAAGEINAVLMHFNPIPNSSSAYRRAAVLEVGGYESRYRYATEYDLWLRLAERWRLVALEEPLSTRFMGSANVAARAERAQIAEALLIRARALRRRRTLRGTRGLLLPAISYATPLRLKRARRRRLGQAP